MIYEAMKLVVDQVNDYLEVNDKGQMDGDLVVLGNIAMVEGAANEASSLKNKIVLTLLNIEEESTLKNTRTYTLNNTKVYYHNPPIHLNLFLLFSATSSTYDTALIHLARLIQFFQGKRVFNNENTPVFMDKEFNRFKLVMEIYSANFEEMKNMWTNLGGKQYPSIIYKLRMVHILREATLHEGKLVKDIQAKSKSDDLQ